MIQSNEWRLFFIIVLLGLCSSAWGQIQIPGDPASFDLLGNEVKEIPKLQYRYSEDEAKTSKGEAYDVGAAEHVNINFFNSARKSTTSDFEIYQLKIEVQNALGIGLNFDEFFLPEGGKLFAYNEDRTIVYGAYTSDNNKKDRKFAIQPISGEVMILEYNQAISNKKSASMNINRIAKIYRPLFADENSASSRDSKCYTDVHCVSGIEVERSVMKWSFYDDKEEGYFVCSCFLVNQDVSSNDVKPYVLTANHCGKNAELSTGVFYFNYQNTTCEAEDANQFLYSMVGSSKRAKRYVLDMYLMELYSFPPPDYNVHLSGWTRSKVWNLYPQMMGIHHPAGDEKNVSLGILLGTPNPNFWDVSYNENDTPVQGGSSGSPVFERSRNRAIGWLTYSLATCEDPEVFAGYGKFHKAWTGPSSSTRLRNWLDPHDHDANAIDGRDPCFKDLTINNRVFYSAQEDYQPENKVTVQAGNRMKTTGNVVIVPNAEYKFTAGKELVFQSGFWAAASCDFYATIEPCDQIAKNFADVTTDGDKDLINQEYSSSDLDALNTEITLYPNPSQGRTTINYTLATPGIISIDIYSINGELIKNVIHQKTHDAGMHQIEFDASHLAKSIYTCVLKTADTISTQKLVVY